MKYTRRNIYHHLNENISFSKKLMIIGGILTLLITSVSLISPYLYKTLVDDVMTVGATLNECAKVLLKAGADSVYTVTFAITCKK